MTIREKLKTFNQIKADIDRLISSDLEFDYFGCINPRESHRAFFIRFVKPDGFYRIIEAESILTPCIRVYDSGYSPTEKIKVNSDVHLMPHVYLVSGELKKVYDYLAEKTQAEAMEL